MLLAKDIMIDGKKMPIVDHKKQLREILKVMNEKKLGIVVIIKNKFISGLLTDGDLRRGIKYFSKNQNLKKIINHKPFIVNENMPASKALAIMSEKKITSLLVVSDKNFKQKNKMLKGIIHIHTLLQNGIK